MAEDKNEMSFTSSYKRSVYTEFFTLIDIDDKNVRVRCKLCPPTSKKTYSCALNSTANLKKHLQVNKVYDYE